MDAFSTVHCSHTAPLSASILTGRRPLTTTTSPYFTLSVKLSPESENPTPSSANFRRPSTHKPLQTPPKHTTPNPRLSQNPLKNLISPNDSSTPTTTTTSNTSQSQSITNKLRLTSKLAPPPPPPPPPPEEIHFQGNEVKGMGNSDPSSTGEDEKPAIEYRQEGKIFVGNLPLWIKKKELADFFRQFGPIENVILIKGHDDTERNMGFGFVIYGGRAAERSAMRAVEFDGVEFHGRVLTVKLDDGRRLKARADGRARWVDGEDDGEYRSKWHKERDGLRREFRSVLETQPENWQAVIRAFERIKKVRPL